MKVIKLNRKRRNIVVSRRVILEEEKEKAKQKLLAELEEGQELEGVVKNITDFGVFVDLGGLDGLLAAIQERGLASDYRLIVEPGHVYSSTAGRVGKGYYTAAWLLASMFYSITMSVNMTQCHRYLAAKTCRDAHKAAFLAAGLLFVGAFIWYAPPMVGRVLYEDDIEALAAEPEGAFLPRQFSNSDNIEAHVRGTGPEPWWRPSSPTTTRST